MTSLAARLARPEIHALPPVNLIAGEKGDYRGDIVRLHLNENAHPPLVPGTEAAQLNRYSEPRAPALRHAMAARYGVPSENLLVTRGADDAIDILIRTFCAAGRDSIAISRPTFGAYALFAKIQGAEIVEIDLGPEFTFEPDCYAAQIRAAASVKLAFICSPNNPTGNVAAPADVLQVADALPETIIVLDEAYIEFSDLASLAAEATRRENLVILRTLSKAYGLAGARIGCAIGNVELIQLIAKVLPPFPLSGSSVAAALATLSPSRRLLLAERIAGIRAERDRIALGLAGTPMVRRLWPSETNFLLLELDDIEAAIEAFTQAGIRIRQRPDIGPGVIRLSIGTKAENDLALAVLGLPVAPMTTRCGETMRDTAETRATARVDLDRASPRRIESGIPFFDHMLDQVAAHGGFSLLLTCDGDTEVDAHHSIEDSAIAFGRALGAALGARRGIGRFGFALPMDEAEAKILVDLSGRPFSTFEGSFAASHIGAYPTEMTAHVFRSLATSLGATIHVAVTGENDHHKTEACYKALGRALRQAVTLVDADRMPSTKGVLA